MAPQADLVIANQSGSAFRADLNNQLAALGTLMSGSSAPSTTYAYMLWADTTNGVLKIRNSANNAWIELLQLDGTLTMEDGAEATPGLAFRDDLNTGIWSSAADTFNISTGSNVALTLDSSQNANFTGNLGIGSSARTSEFLFIQTPSGSSGSPTTKAGIVVKDGSFADGALFDGQDSTGSSVFKVLSTGDLEQSGDLIISTSGKGIRANGPNNSTYGQLKIQVDVPDGSGSGNEATFKKATSGIVLAFPSGGGIDFSASSNQAGVFTGGETLTDYECGTYTPNLLAHGGSWSTVTLSSGSKYGSYVKIGNMVHVQAYFTDFHVDSAHDNDLVGITLPIAADSGNTGYSALTTVHANCFVSGKQTNFFVISNSSNAYGIQEGSTGYDTWKGDASRYLMVAGTYRAG